MIAGWHGALQHDGNHHRTNRQKASCIAHTTAYCAGVLRNRAGQRDRLCQQLWGAFVFDDVGAIDENPSIRSLWPIWPVLFSSTFASVAGRPLLNLSLAIDHALWGNRVWGFHLTNVLFHTLAALLLFAVIRRTLLLPALRDHFGSSATSLALIATLIWTVHPLQTESVTYIVQRSEAMVGFFYLLSLYCLIRADGAVRPAIWYGAGVISCLLGMATKEVMVSAPLVLLLYDRIFLSISFRQTLRQRWPFHLATAATWAVLGALMLTSGRREGSAGFGLGMGAREYAATQFGIITHYLRLCFWPRPLVLDYGVDTVHQASQIVPYAIFIVLLIGVTIWALARKPELGFLGFCFFAILAPTSSFVPLAGQVAAEHRMYLPLACVVISVMLLG